MPTFFKTKNRNIIKVNYKKYQNKKRLAILVVLFFI